MDDEYLQIAKIIDHAILHPTSSDQQIEQGCLTAVAYQVASVCVIPSALTRCVDLLADSTVLPSTTIGFPHGVQSTSTKVAEAQYAIDQGCQELELVCNISKVLSCDWTYVRSEIQALVSLAHAAQRKIKVIFENGYLRTEHKIRLCEICCQLQADWVKTSTGFGPSGATIEDIHLMAQHVQGPVQVKASGGIRDLQTLREMQALGATRIGTSHTQAILDPLRSEWGLPPVQQADPSSTMG